MRKDLLLGVLQVHYIVLDEGIVDHIVDMQFEAPRHRDFPFAGEINEVSDNFIDI